MPRVKLLAVTAACCALLGAGSSSTKQLLEVKRSSPSDLQITGVAPGTSRYISYEKLLTLPQATVTVIGDDNFVEMHREKVEVTGIYLDVLAKYLGAKPDSDLISAQCSDGYRTNYSRDYILAHRPILVLKIDGLPVKNWVSQTHNEDLGTYFITHEVFTPSFDVLSVSETPQVPIDIVRLDFSSKRLVFGAIAPHGLFAPGDQVMDGYRIAEQHCFRCHNMGSHGGTKAKVTWQQLGFDAATPAAFEAYLLNPKSNYHEASTQPGSRFDDATAKALQAYFQTFAPGGS